MAASRPAVSWTYSSSNNMAFANLAGFFKGSNGCIASASMNSAGLRSGATTARCEFYSGCSGEGLSRCASPEATMWALLIVPGQPSR